MLTRRLFSCKRQFWQQVATLATFIVSLPHAHQRRAGFRHPSRHGANSTQSLFVSRVARLFLRDICTGYRLEASCYDVVAKSLGLSTLGLWLPGVVLRCFEVDGNTRTRLIDSGVESEQRLGYIEGIQLGSRMEVQPDERVSVCWVSRGRCAAVG